MPWDIAVFTSWWFGKGTKYPGEMSVLAYDNLSRSGRHSWKLTVVVLCAQRPNALVILILMDCLPPTLTPSGFSIKAVPFPNAILNVKELGGKKSVFLCTFSACVTHKKSICVHLSELICDEWLKPGVQWIINYSNHVYIWTAQLRSGFIHSKCEKEIWKGRRGGFECAFVSKLSFNVFFSVTPLPGITSFFTIIYQHK